MYTTSKISEMWVLLRSQRNSRERVVVVETAQLRVDRTISRYSQAQYRYTRSATKLRLSI